MSWWTHINGTITVSPAGRTQAEMRYILETVLNHLPRVTGSEGDMNVHIVQKEGYDHFSSCDEYGEHTNNLVNDYGHKTRRGWHRMQTKYILVLEGNLRDRMIKQTLREFMNWICRLAKRVRVHECLVKIYPDYGKPILIDDAEDKFYKMFEGYSWSSDDGLPNWCEHLMWENYKHSDYPLLLVYKYYNDPEVDKEIERRIDFEEV